MARTAYRPLPVARHAPEECSFQSAPVRASTRTPLSIPSDLDRSSSPAAGTGARVKARTRGKAKARGRWPLAPEAEGLTVDELARHRRRRVQGRPEDGPGLCRPENREEDDPLVTEYRRAFGEVSKENLRPFLRKKPEDCLHLEGLFDDAVSSHLDFRFYPEHLRVPRRSRAPADGVSLAGPSGEDAAMETETESSRFVAHSDLSARPPPVRRGTSLKRGGDFRADTEYSAYVAHQGRHRAELARRPTSLKMEGDLDAVTEKRDKFVEWLNASRPEPMRLPSNLKLEGDLETATESRDKYVPFVGTRRPELLRQSAHLKMEGDFGYVPEYRDVFRPFGLGERRMPRKPETNLGPSGDFYGTTETSEKYVHPSRREEESVVRVEAPEEEEEAVEALVSKMEDWKGPPLEIPEYRDAYRDFPRERPKLARPEDEIGRADGSKVSSSPALSRFSTKIDLDPEYKSKYLQDAKDAGDAKDRLVFRKPPTTSRPSPLSGSSGRLDDLASEVRSQYVPYGRVPRVETLRMPANLRLEGSMDLRPEYRNAYCAVRDPPVSSEPRMHRRRDRSLSASRRKNDCWTTDYGERSAADAFRILDPRAPENRVLGKPPLGSGRNSRSSQTQTQGSPLDSFDRPVLRNQRTQRNRSPSPTYRLHVCNVDDEPQGFGRRRPSPSLQSSTEPIRASSPEKPTRSNETRRPYSPSFGRTAGKNTNERSFVVLDDRKPIPSKLDRYNDDNVRRAFDGVASSTRGKPGHPSGASSNWMPSWYDGTTDV
ncbi:uncharacterized protein LOC105701937 [Orussus abietinus]|uniref:uncharacterized protein LOC105701937 n=1 Tax=Orussus abietinus TaxID=222816 RepID=UPI00062537F5|nr:uncharacterized protein LOC105701937 [Orussus abietinus]